MAHSAATTSRTLTEGVVMETDESDSLRLLLGPPAKIPRLEPQDQPPRDPLEDDVTGLSSPDPSIRFEALRRIERRLQNRSITPAQLLDVIERHLQNEPEQELRIFAIRTLGVLGSAPEADGPAVANLLLRQLLPSSREDDMICQVLSSLGQVCKAQTLNPTLHSSLEKTCTRYLDSSDHRTRANCLKILSYVSQNQAAITRLVKDPDARVRVAALEALLTLHKREILLSSSLYDIAVATLGDEVEDVRHEAIMLIFVLSHLYAKTKVEIPAYNIKVRLVDDGFVKICDMVNDISMRVRTKACAILGSFDGIDPKYLMQTLSKQIMSNLKVKASVSESEREGHGYQPGARRAFFSPEGDTEISQEEISLLETGACGAFVHGLEDEFLEVREAATKSICELALKSEEFAVACIDSLVDMFNDEIDQIRITAIKALLRMGAERGITLKEDQLQIVLSNLEDALPNIRSILHELLGTVKFSNIAGLAMAVQSLVDNFKKYPQDRASVFRSFKGMGTVHACFTEFLVESLLKTDPKFLTQEQSIEDPVYACHLILIFNASMSNPAILSLLPKHCFQHYLYFRNMYPDAFQPGYPNLSLDLTRIGVMEQNLTREFEVGSRTLVGDGDDGVEKLLKFLQNKKEELAAIDLRANTQLSAAKSLLKASLASVEHLGSLHPKLKGKTGYLSRYLECYLLLLQVKTLLGKGQIPAACKLAETFALHSYEMQHLFTGHAFSTEYLQFRLVGHLLWIISNSTQSNSSTSAKPRENYISTAVKRVNEILQSLGQVPNEAFANLRTALQQFDTDPDISRLIGFLEQLVPLRRDLDASTRISSTIQHPHPNPEKPYEFLFTFPWRINLSAEISHLQNSREIFLRVTFPNQTVQIFWPPLTDFVTTGTSTTLSTVIYIHSPHPWTDSAAAVIEVMKSAECDEESPDRHLLATHLSSSESGKESRQSLSLPIGTPLKYHIFPKR